MPAPIERTTWPWYQIQLTLLTSPLLQLDTVFLGGRVRLSPARRAQTRSEASPIKHVTPVQARPVVLQRALSARLCVRRPGRFQLH